VDSDGDGFVELVVPVNSDADIVGESFTLTQISLVSPVYRGEVRLSSTKGLTSDADGVIFIQENGEGSNPVAVSAHYTDQDINVAAPAAYGACPPAGTNPFCVPCPDNPLSDTMLTQFAGSDVLFVTARVTDEGANADGDGIADPGETVRLDISVVNSVLDSVWEKPDLEDVSLTLISESRNVGPDKPIACILDGSSHYGLLESGIARFNDPADPFRFVVGNVERSSPGQVLQAEFTLGIQGRYVDGLGVERSVTSFRTPQRFAIGLDLDIVGTATPLAADFACVGGSHPGRACAGPENCPGTKGDGSPATCDPLPARFQAGGDGLMAGQVGYFEGFEGAVNMGGRESGLTVGPWPDLIEGTGFMHSPALNAAGGYLDGGLVGNNLDFQAGPLTPGASPGNAMDDPEGSSGVDGVRCQYNDPRGPKKHPRWENFCRPWAGSAWHANDNKAFTGGKSLYGGLSGQEERGMENWDTNHIGALFAAFTPPLNIGVAGNATLSIHHIVQMTDYRCFSLPAPEAAGRAFLEWAEVDPVSGSPVGAWNKLNGFQNNYGNTGMKPRFANCMFDGYDDFYDATAVLGGTPGFDVNATSPVGVQYNADGIGSEDDYFDPNDPERLLGPSSSCFPQYVYSSLGHYVWTNVELVGDAFTEGELGETGSGTWVNSLFNLDAAAGRSIRIRFVLTDLDFGWFNGYAWADIFSGPLGNCVRGWRLDDVAVSGLVDQPLTLVPDPRVPPSGDCPVDPDPGTPLNEAACGVVTADAGADVVTPVSGSVVTLDASASFADQCVDGYLEYRWRLGGATFGEYSTDPLLIDAPVITTVYTVDVRCSTDPECLGSDSVSVVPADELEVSGSPGELGSVEPGSGAASAATTRWLEPPVGGPHTVNVLGVNLVHNGVALRDVAGRTASAATLSAAVRDSLCNLGTATNLGDRLVELTDTTLELESNEIVGYLAVTTNAQGIVGTLGRGEQIGAPPAFARGRRTPGSLPACVP
jgi:hypothetical protein